MIQKRDPSLTMCYGCCLPINTGDEFYDTQIDGVRRSFHKECTLATKPAMKAKWELE